MAADPVPSVLDVVAPGTRGPEADGSVRRPTQQRLAASGLVLLGLAGVALGAAIAYSSGLSSLPVVMLLIPVLAIALWAGPVVTGITAVAAATTGTALLVVMPPESYLWLRLAALVAGCALATALSGARRHREEAFAEQRAELSLARYRGESERLMAQMLERLPELSGARSIDDVTQRACRIARDLFDADAVSYWALEGKDAVLVSREPAGPLARGTRMPRNLLHPTPYVAADSRTSWTRRSTLAEDDVRRSVMERSGAEAGASTPVRVDFVTVGILALSWVHDRPDPDPAWLERLERFAEQTALAKTVVRRTLAQQESRDLTDRLQASFLPAAVTEVPNASVRLLYRPGLSQMLMGGDFVDVTARGDGTAFLIGDVSGHGPEQAALAAVVRAAWRGAVSVPGSSLTDWVVALETVVQDRRPSDGLFVTAVTGCLDAHMSQMEYVSAGHPPPILLPSCRAAPIGGPPLGFTPVVRSHRVHCVSLEGQKAVLLVTDGLFEGFVAPDSRLRVGYDGLLDLIREEHRDAVHEPDFLGTLTDTLEAMNGGPLPDDAAALVLVRRSDV